MALQSQHLSSFRAGMHKAGPLRGTGAKQTHRRCRQPSRSCTGSSRAPGTCRTALVHQEFKRRPSVVGNPHLARLVGLGLQIGWGSSEAECGWGGLRM
eukprot:4060635-Alexandrium_andersonii.AAC.1